MSHHLIAMMATGAITYIKKLQTILFRLNTLEAESIKRMFYGLS
jgi:hypothetical protein